MQKRKIIKKSAKKTVVKLKAVNKPIGTVTHYYGGIKVGIFKFTKPVKIGEEICVKGATTDFKQTINSIQFDHKPIASAQKGKEVGIKVKKKVREGDEVFETDK